MSAAAKLTQVLGTEVVIIDVNTAEPIGIGGPQRRALSPEHDPELYQAETKTPEGPPALLHEHRVWPKLMAIFGIAGLVIVATLFYWRGGWNAAALGVAWLSMAYAVSWIVVWAAGVARARDEIELEHQIEQRHRQG